MSVLSTLIKRVSKLEKELALMQQVDSRFTAYTFSEEEEKLGIHLDALQVAIIRNEIAAYATEKSNLNLDPEHPLYFMQAEAELKGKILALEYLLSLNIEE